MPGRPRGDSGVLPVWNGTVLLAGVLLLYLGAEWLVKGAAGLGRS